MPWVKAVDKGIKKLYHYDKFCPKYLADTLAMQRVHFSNPSNFNDPWDCYPCFDTRQADNADYRARCIEFLQEFPLPHLSDSKRTLYERKLHADPNLFVEMLQTDFSDALRNNVVDRWRIYCLTPKADIPLMWSHYSNHHRGICLEFDTSEPHFGNAAKVEYQKTLPAIDIINITDEASFNILVTKSPDWCYESEYRILARDKSAGEGLVPPFPITTDDFLPLNPGALTGIILGCRADVETITALVKKHAPGLSVKRAIQSVDNYTLFIQ
jgi:hypothetical protein